MSMSIFIDHPAVRDAFKRHATNVAFPWEARARDMLVPPRGAPSRELGHAWNYMFLFQASRKLAAAAPVAMIHETAWLAEEAVTAMQADDRLRPYHARWSFLVAKARELYRDYLVG